DSEIDPAAYTISPFPLLNQSHGRADCQSLDSPSIVGSALAQQVLQTELQAATEKVAQLEAQERRSNSEGGAHSTRRRLWWLASERRRSHSDLEADLRVAREEISLLVAGINALEANSNFAEDNAAVEGPPPDY
ncbi:hypothetical protein R3P38DRAFT_2486366, partial [Favolaschia claudopus]